MSFICAVPIDEVVYVPDVTTHDPATGAVTDADSAPTFSVFEEATDTPIVADATMTKRTSLTGDYRGTFTASAANGFEAGKWYNVVATAIVDSVTAKQTIMQFMAVPAMSVAGVPKTDAGYFAGQTITAAAGVTLPASVASPTNITAGVITTVTNLTNAPTAGDLTATMKTSVTAAALATAMAESYAADGATNTVAQALYMILGLLGEHAIATTHKTVKKLDGSTTAGVFDLDDATNPTSITRAS